MTFDIIIFTDATGLFYKQKTLGAWHIANILRQRGYTVLVVDYFSRYIRNQKKLQELLQLAVGPNTKLIGFSSTFFTYNLPEDKIWDNWITYYGLDMPDFYCGGDKDSVENLFEMCRLYSPNCQFFYGGNLASHTRELIYQSPALDYIVIGLGETQVWEIADHVFKNATLRYRLADDLKTKILDWDIVAKDFDFHNNGVIEYQSYDVILPNETLSLQTSRGCMYNCAFCSFPLRGRKRNKIDYHLNWQGLANYFRRNYELWGVTRYQLVDDTFNETTDKLKNFARAIKESGVPIQWFSFMRVDLVDQEQIELMAETDCKSIWFGLETLNPQALKGIDKNYDPEDALLTIEKITNATDINIFASIIFGLNYDKESDIRSWMSQLMDTSVACIGVNPLGGSERTAFTSSINKNPEKYGYEFDLSSRYELNWTNQTWDSYAAIDLTLEYQKLLWDKKRNLVSSFELLGLPFHGYDIEFLSNLPISDIPFAEIFENIKEKFELYHTLLLIELNQDHC